MEQIKSGWRKQNIFNFPYFLHLPHSPHFTWQLRRAGVPPAQLLHFYMTVIRPVLEYAAPVWHHLLTKAHTDQIEAIRRRALRIALSFTNDMPYSNALYCANMPSLSDRREQLSRKFFKSILEPVSSLHSLHCNIVLCFVFTFTVLHYFMLFGLMATRMK